MQPLFCDLITSQPAHAQGVSCCRLTKPDEIYNLGAQSHVQVSFELPQYTAEASGVVSPPNTQPQRPLLCDLHFLTSAT